MIPLVTARAIKLIGAHPAVAAVRVVSDTDDGQLVVGVDLVTELPAAWRPAGESPSGVRAIETISFVFAPNYPLRAPAIFLREDFNRTHPHIDPGPPEEPPRPCIVAGSPAELLQSRGIEGLIDQLADWLDKASLFALNNGAQGWEPVRRDSVDDLMVVDGEKLRSMVCPAGGCNLVATSFVLGENEKRVYFVDHRTCATVTLATAKFGRGATGPNQWVGTAIGIVVWAADRPPGVPFVVGEYAPETVTTVRDLRDRAARYGCLSQFDGAFNQLAYGLHQRTIEPTPLTIIFLVRRPSVVIGTGSPIELCAYLIHVTSSRDLIDEDRAVVRLCQAREQVSVQILRRASGEDESRERAQWTLWGCGSIGSKIAVHMGRRGFGPARVVDHAIMSPHNFARHALLPVAAGGLGLGFKATMLADALAAFQQRPEAHVVDVISLCESSEGRDGIAPVDGGILNTTASTVVRERVAFAEWQERPAIGEAHLLGAGRVGYAAFEGRDGNPNLSDLATESYHLISQDAELRRIVFDARAEAIAIGQGCSAMTFPMPDDRLSALAASLAEAVALRGFPGHGVGELVLGKIGGDGISQSWTRTPCRPWTIVKHNGMQVRISSRADEKIRAEIAARPETETGGVILGRFSQIGNAFQVVDVLPAPPDSSFAPNKFVLGTKGLRANIREITKTSGGTLYALGTWHNHLAKTGPSSLDAQTARKLALRQFFPVLMLIALPEGYTYLVAEAFDLHDLKRGGG